MNTTTGIEHLEGMVIVDQKEKQDNDLIENAIYEMTKGEGWRQMMKHYRQEKFKLLQPIPTSEVTTETNLETIGAMAIARSARIETLDSFVNFAETIRVVREMKNDTETQVESRQEA